MSRTKTFTITITEDEEDGGFVGRCDELHANSQGETYEETVENMKEAVELAVEDDLRYQHTEPVGHAIQGVVELAAEGDPRNPDLLVQQSLRRKSAKFLVTI